MRATHRITRGLVMAAVSLSYLSHAASPPAPAASIVRVRLSGAEEIPPVSTPASGLGVISVGPDRSVTASVTTSGFVPSVGHIHDAAPGKNGGIIIPLVQTSDGVWSAPAGVKLTEVQYESYKAGNLYFNIHSAAHRSGEIRGQIKP